MSPYPHEPDPWKEPRQEPAVPGMHREPAALPHAYDEPEASNPSDLEHDGQWYPSRSNHAPPSHPLRGAFAWILIVICSCVLVVLQFLGMQAMSEQAEDDTRPGQTALYLARCGVGMEQFPLFRGTSGQMLAEYDALARQSKHTEAALLRGAILAGELVGRAEAQDRLTQLQQFSRYDLLPEPEQQIDFAPDLITRIYQDPSYVPTKIERKALIEQHGWFGELAAGFNLPASDPLYQDPRNSAKRMMLGLVAMVGIIGTAILTGFVLFITLIILFATGWQKTRFVSGPSGSRVVYLELVALFLLLFILLQLLFGWLGSVTGRDWTLAFLLLSPMVLVWPRLMGVPWAQYKIDMGFHRGQGLIREIGSGILGYLAGLPIILMGMAVTVVLGLFSGGSADHPMQQDIADGNLFSILVLLGAACVWAPLVEEAVFRSAFYRHLRQRRGVPSWLIATLVTSFIFAVIHPQGWLGVPVLMSIAFVLAWLREWRGSIVPSITAHALHNGTIMSMLLIVLYA